ncbi:hypothetical protein HK105_201597 [Polyrhizophydium stewartii]|uniref:Uncharacterized protein n=1 Tax=Polyrhizophydium stewartii TaxID=2732419 RepID=A0ABR4NGV0_9FUNG|nr:hypothetical protein HK105_001290 [Polyrhizophydium stewartii]
MRPTRALLQAAVFKKTTGIFGYPVHPDPKPALESLYSRILHSLSKLPDSSTYKHSTHTLVNQRLNALKAAESVAAFEAEIGAGQIEELIEHAETELSLIPKMVEWQVWQPLEVKPLPGQWKGFDSS